MMIKLWGGPYDGQHTMYSEEFIKKGVAQCLYKRESVRYGSPEKLYVAYIFYDELIIQKQKIKDWLTGV